jgi:hypothetical protein
MDQFEKLHTRVKQASEHNLYIFIVCAALILYPIAHWCMTVETNNLFKLVLFGAWLIWAWITQRYIKDSDQLRDLLTARRKDYQALAAENEGLRTQLEPDEDEEPEGSG